MSGTARLPLFGYDESTNKRNSSSLSPVRSPARGFFLSVGQDAGRPLPDCAPMDEPDWLLWGRQLQSLAQHGLTFAKDPYDGHRHGGPSSTGARRNCLRTSSALQQAAPFYRSAPGSLRTGSRVRLARTSTSKIRCHGRTTSMASRCSRTTLPSVGR